MLNGGRARGTGLAAVCRMFVPPGGRSIHFPIHFLLVLMSLNQRVVDDMKTAMREGDKLRLETLRMLRASFLELEKSGREVTYERELSVVIKHVKGRKEAADMYRQAGRDDLAVREDSEREIIEEYLPAQLSDDEIVAELREIIAVTGASSPADFKLAMPRAAAATKGRADGARVSALLKELLSNLGT